eukprot:3539285-Rhodomonas_salina.2
MAKDQDVRFAPPPLILMRVPHLPNSTVFPRPEHARVTSSGVCGLSDTDDGVCGADHGRAL